MKLVSVETRVKELVRRGGPWRHPNSTQHPLPHVVWDAVWRHVAERVWERVE